MTDSPCTFQCKLVTIDTNEITILKDNKLLNKDCIDIELCASCGRTRSEIVNWSQLDPIDKENVFRISNERLLRKLAKN